MTVYTDATRDDCQLGSKRISYAKLQREYRCNECGGRIVIKPPANGEDWHPECGRCEGRDFIHGYQLQRQKAEAAEVLDGLPPELVAQLT
jgi:DNA-directed RNA polymerase subunit RPC12/RpoP